jgi:Bax protein
MQKPQPTFNQRTLLGKIRKLVMTALASLILLQIQAQNRSFEEKYGPLADSLGAVYGIPSSVILGVAIIESGSGKSRNARLLNNFFGVKGKNNLLKTKGIRSSYKQYPNDTASFVSFCGLVSRKKFYSKLKGNPDYRLWTDALSHAGYSEIPETWEKLINSTIRKHQLYKR